MPTPKLIGRLAHTTTFVQARSRFDLLTAEMQADLPEEWRSRQEDVHIRELSVRVGSLVGSHPIQRLYPAVVQYSG